MIDVNTCIFTGNLTANPEMRTTPSGIAVTDFGIAVNNTSIVKGEKKEDVAFLNFTCFGKSAENVARYCHKGSPVLVESHVITQRWTDKNTGKNRSSLKFYADYIQFLDRSKPKQEQGQEPEHRYSRQDTVPQMPEPEQPPQNEPVPGINDDIPF